MRTLLAILLLVLIALQLKMWLGEGGYRDVKRLAVRVEEQAKENETLAQRNRELEAEVEDLRQGLHAVEKGHAANWVWSRKMRSSTRWFPEKKHQGMTEPGSKS